MPIPSRKTNEKKDSFISRCMSSDIMNKEYPNESQRYAVCLNQSKGSLSQQVSDIVNKEDMIYGYTEDISDNIFIPVENDYLDFGEEPEEYVISVYKYKNPRTGELFIYDNRGIHIKDGHVLIYVGKAAEYQGRKVTLNKPFRTPDGPKKFSVYVKNDKGNVVKVNFGDPNMKIKKNIPERRKSFRARHNCDNPGPKWKARYWSCKAW